MYQHQIIAFICFGAVFFGITLSTSLFIWGISAWRSSAATSAIEPSPAASVDKLKESIQRVDASLSNDKPPFAAFDESTLGSESGSTISRGSTQIPRPSNTRRRTSENRRSLLSHIEIGSSADHSEDEVSRSELRTRVKDEDEDDKATIISRTSSTSQTGSTTSTWQDIAAEIELPADADLDDVKVEDDDNMTIGGVSFLVALDV